MADRDELLKEAIIKIDAAMAKQDGGPWLFHGTSRKKADSIAANGFDPSKSWVWTQKETDKHPVIHPCVFWTRDVHYAAMCALKYNVDADEFEKGSVFAAPFADVIASGQPVPDTCMWEIETGSNPDYYPSDWGDSLEKLGCIAVLECRVVKSLIRIELEDNSS